MYSLTSFDINTSRRIGVIRRTNKRKMAINHNISISMFTPFGFSYGLSNKIQVSFWTRKLFMIESKTLNLLLSLLVIYDVGLAGGEQSFCTADLHSLLEFTNVRPINSQSHSKSIYTGWFGKSLDDSIVNYMENIIYELRSRDISFSVCTLIYTL